MRKILLLMAGICTLSVSAQLTVVSNNHVEIGTPALNIGSPISSSQKAPVINPEMNKVRPDSLATLTLLGRGSQNRGAYITFAGERSVSIGDYYPSASSPAGVMLLNGAYGIRYQTDDNNQIFRYTKRGSATQSFYFYCPVVANGVSLTSDARLKKEVRSNDDEYLKLFELNSINYKIKCQPSVEESAVAARADGKLPELPESGDDRIRYGYIAQEVREIFPDLVSEDENGYLSVDYIGLIPLLVDAVKNLSAKVDVLEHQDEQVFPAVKKVSAGVDGVSEVSAPLSQNRPNPFDSATVIDCTVDEGVQEAFIGIYDLQGKQIMRLDVEQRGKTSVTVDGSALPAGIYIYALVADGKEIATKRMIVSQ